MADTFENLDPEFKRRIVKAIADAEAATGAPVQVNSGFRSRDDQAQAYANYIYNIVGQKSWTDPETGKTYQAEHKTSLAAYPGSSYHEQGQAVDIQPNKSLDWMKQHASDYGIEALAGNAGVIDPVHMQLARYSQAPQVPPPIPQLRPGEGAPATGPAQDYTRYTSGLSGADYQAPQQSNDYDPLASGTYPRSFTQAPAGDPNDYDPLASGSYSVAPPAALVAQGPDNLGDSHGMSPLRQYTAYEPDSIPAGPYGADSLARAFTVGDPGAIATMGDQLYRNVVAKYGEPSVFNMVPLLAAQKEITEYFTKTLPTQAPGAVRQVQTALANDPKLSGLIPKDQQQYFAKAFSALPQQTTGMTAMPNMRPSTIPDMQPPLVASAPSDPYAPKMASFAQPQSPAVDPNDYDPLASGTYPMYPPPPPAAPQMSMLPNGGQTMTMQPRAAAATPTGMQTAWGTDPMGTAFGRSTGPQWGVSTQQMGMLPNGGQTMSMFPSPPTATMGFAQPPPNMSPQTQPQTLTQALVSQAPQPQQPQQPPPMPTFGPTGPSVDVSGMGTQTTANAFAAAHSDNPAFQQPTDDQGNFAPTSWSGGWGYDESQFIPDLDAMNGNRGWA